MSEQDRAARMQDAFDKVWQHFVVERGPMSAAIVTEEMETMAAGYEAGDVRCLYSGPEGARCAFSVLLTDDEREAAHAAYEGEKASSLIDGLPITRFEDIAGFCDALQNAHDHAARVALSNDDDFHANIEQQLRSFTSWGVRVPSGAS
jgi:hypothetical protein